MEIEMQAVSSSNISAIGYDEILNELHVQFKKSGVYIYENVKKETFEQFVNSESKGKFFLSNIKPHYKCIPPKK